MTPAQRAALAALWPRYGVEPQTVPLDIAALFARHAPVVCEIGFGNGDHLLAAALAQPHNNFLGIEVHRPGVGRLLARAAVHDVGNLRVSTEDAVTVLRDWLPAAALAELVIYFPDPWPKKRHHKRRLLQPDFVHLVAMRLAPRGVMRLATDWSDYAQQMLDVCGAEPLLRNLSPDGTCVVRPPTRPLTRFEQRGQKLGHEVFDFAFRRVHDRDSEG
jgi:tRNA (guanine-N7-)-methyltransferase